jgi:UPF0716 protein FxsA
MLPLFLLFVILPIAEIMLLINVADGIGNWNTFFIVLVTAFFGAYFVRQQGFALIQQLQTKLASGQAPTTEMAEGLLLLVAGVLLITPGFLTDGLGFLFTLPFSRGPIAKFMMLKIISRKTSGNFQFHAHSQHGFKGGFTDNKEDEGDIIEGEIVESERDNKNNQNSSKHNNHLN